MRFQSYPLEARRAFSAATLFIFLVVGLATAQAQALSIPYPGINPGQVGVPYTMTYAAAGGVRPYTWTLASGTIPPGLSVSTHKSQGQIIGTPTGWGDYKFAITVTDTASHSVTVNEDLYIASAPNSGGGSSGTSSAGSTGSTSGTTSSGSATTTPPAALSIPYPGIDPGILGVAYSKTYVAAGGVPPYTWSIPAGNPAPGMSLSSAGVLGGTPTAGGDFQFQMRVTDSPRIRSQSARTCISAEDRPPPAVRAALPSLPHRRPSTRSRW